MTKSSTHPPEKKTANTAAVCCAAGWPPIRLTRVTADPVPRFTWKAVSR